ncbi:MAG TPA: zinc ribbon domain-containing protein [Candidatus Bathyarchaeia archaeon]|nr:zinc ribbon domain-containing protein [Candidatus Bathyarchaeia archaeon]
MIPEHSAPVIQPNQLENKEGLTEQVASPQDTLTFESPAIETNRTEPTLDQPQAEGNVTFRYDHSELPAYDYWRLFYWISGVAGLLIGAYTVSQASLIGFPTPSVLLAIDGVGVMIFAATQILAGLLRQTQWVWRSLTERIIASTYLLWGILGILIGLLALGLMNKYSIKIATIIYLSTTWNILGCIGLGSIVLTYWYWNLHAPLQAPLWSRPPGSPYVHETILHYPGAYCIRCGMPLKRDDRYCSYCGSLKEG